MHHSLLIRLWKMLVSTKKSWIGQVVHAKHWLYICKHWLSRSWRYPLLGPTNPILSRFKEDWNAFSWLDCKTIVFFSKSVKKSVKRGVRVLRARSSRASHALLSPQSRSVFSASFQTFCSTPRAYLNTQQYGVFCSLSHDGLFPTILSQNFFHVILYFSKTPLAARTVETTCWASIRYFHYIARLFLEDSSVKDDQ